MNLLEISTDLLPPDLKSLLIALAYDAARQGGTLPAYLSVANEVLVDAFLNERISFGMILAI